MKAHIKAIKLSERQGVILMETEEGLDYAFFMKDQRQKAFFYDWLRRQKALRKFEGERPTLKRCLSEILHTTTDIPKAYLYPYTMGA